MTNYREILRLDCLGLNKTQIAEACGCSRTTVIQTLRLAKKKRLQYFRALARSLRLIGLCPNPRFIAWRFPGRVIADGSYQKRAIPARVRMASLFPLKPVYGAHVASQRCTILRYG